MNSFLLASIEALQKALGAKALPELITTSNPGSSGSRVTIFKNPKTDTLYAVKCSIRGRVSYTDESIRAKNLEQALPGRVSRVIWVGVQYGYEVLISECYGIDTMYMSLVYGRSSISNLVILWNDFLTELTTMWIKSQSRPYKEELNPRYFPTRKGRVEQGLIDWLDRNHLGKAYESPLRINGESFPSLREIINKISPQSPLQSVTCHGDPHPANIVVSGSKWYLVDFEWSGNYHDWRTMFSHLNGWWLTRLSYSLSEASIASKPNGLALSYDIKQPEYVEEFLQINQVHLNSLICKGFAREQDLKDINLFIALLWLGELRFIASWNKEHMAIPLIGEAVKYVMKEGNE